MIADALWGILSTLIGPLLDVLPTFPWSDDMTAWGDSLSTALWRVDQWVPILAPLGMLRTVLGWGALFVPVAVAVWLWRLLPGKAT